MSKNVFLETWKLDSLFKGFGDSLELLELMAQTKLGIEECTERIIALNLSTGQSNEKLIAIVLRDMGCIQNAVSQISSFIVCLLAENPANQKAISLQGQISSIKADHSSLVQRFQKKVAEMEPSLWNTLINTESLQDYRFILEEWRENANSGLSVEEEKLISNLMVDGYHAWNDLYRSIINNLRVTIDVDDREQEFSIGQATNLRSRTDQTIRKNAFIALENTWTNQQETMARILNHITGFRLQVDQKRGKSNSLEQPLKDNRMSEATLRAMWQVVARHKPAFVDYLDHKAQLDGHDQMPSYDFWAPYSEKKTSIDYQNGAEFLLEQFRQFGPEVEGFARTAFKKGWVEAENRPGKSALAFCARFPLSEESRVFLTFDGSMTSLLTLAHELGHAFHNHSLKSVAPLNQKYGMSTAETASTFAEMIVLDAAIEQAEDRNEKLQLLDEKIKRSVMNFMNLHSRFLFEERLYEARKQGMVSADRLNRMMEDALNEAYAGSMSHLPVHSWISTPHFYITSSPFYNFPYTFGYLFAVSIYAKAKEQGKDFEKNYLALLRDSGSMNVEDLAMKHLGEDITQESFWEKGMALCLKDVEEFIRLSSKSLVSQ
ncbi:M3 family oligoendopeptidase [Planococcus halotolerans]|uniref:M3 family oligoendopeptidase n=1 Tax=Planococcus halotolerans TaxID=2233542 RepID=UPI001091A9F8|nr:M3 family oligoendopeptidase [Planococcus halotolerans]QHJ69936.1 M3 family oligoendopeptidase [Planococcus halotolerans]